MRKFHDRLFALLLRYSHNDHMQIFSHGKANEDFGGFAAYGCYCLHHCGHMWFRCNCFKNKMPWSIMICCVEPGKGRSPIRLWARFNIKMSSYRYRKSHYGDKTVVRSSYLHNGISYTGKTVSLYWIRVQVSQNENDWNKNKNHILASQAPILLVARVVTEICYSNV